MQFQRQETNFAQKRAAQDEVEEMQCKCNMPAVKRMSQTANNPNREFWCCPQPKAQGCGFFKWCDGQKGSKVPKTAAAAAASNEQLDRIEQKIDELNVSLSILTATIRGKPSAPPPQYLHHTGLDAYSQKE